MTPWIRSSVTLLSLSLLCAGSAIAQTSAQEAKSQFQLLQQEWQSLVKQLQQKNQQKSASGKQGRGPIDHEIDDLYKQSDAMVDKIVAAGIGTVRSGIKDDPMINSTLVAIAGFYVTGDAKGDGGDQYEKALPLIKSMLSADVGKNSPELWLWGGVSAFALNDFSLAKQYLDQARSAGQIGASPPGRGQTDPRNRVWQLAASCANSLAQTRTHWEQEKRIRAAEADADDLPRVKMHTSRGDIVIELLENDAPIAVANFIALVKQDYYDGLTFHRVLPAFMAQGGDNQRGGPGYTIRCECYQPSYRKHFRGSLSMAKPSNPPRDSGSAQFFLTFVPKGHLDGKHTVFGRVIEGMEVAASLKRRNPDPRVPGPKPTPDKIVHAHVLRDRGHQYEFEKLPSQ